MPAWLSGVDWGSAPAWAGLAAATVAAGLAGRNVFVDVADRQRAQALLVAAWWGKVEAVKNPSYRSSVSDGAWVLNGSSAPIYDVRLGYRRRGDEITEVLLTPVLPPTSADDPLFYSFGLLALADVEPIMELLNRFGNISEEDYAGGYLVSLSFRDSGGYTWRRGEDGRLHRR